MNIYGPAGGYWRRKIRLNLESNAKCRHLKKGIWKGTLQQVFICLRPHPFLDFCLGVVEQFCKFWIWSDTDCKTPKEYGLQHDSTPTTPPPPPPHSMCFYILYFDNREGGGEETREKGRGATGESTQITKLGWKYRHDWLVMAPVYKLCVLNWGKFRKSHSVVIA